MSAGKVNRRIHRLGAVLIAVPALLVFGSGILLQLKKELPWVQPPLQSGIASVPSATFDAILEAARSVPEAGIQNWSDIERLDVRPAQGIVKVRSENRWEVQVDAASGEVLQVAYRRSDLIESLHDGSWFGAGPKLFVFLPGAFLLLVLWGTGVYLWLQPHLVKRRRRKMSPGASS